MRNASETAPLGLFSRVEILGMKEGSFPVRMKIDKPSRAEIESAYERAVGIYVQGCRERIPSFLKDNFGLRGSLKRHKVALGHDLWRAPVNALWQLILFMVGTVGFLARKTGYPRIEARCNRVWKGFETDLDRENERLLFEELFQMPQPGDEKRIEDNLLLKTLFERPELSEFKEFLESPEMFGTRLESGHLHLKKNTQKLKRTQGSAAELFSSITLTGATFLTTKSLACGILGAAPAIAQQIAINTFWAGSFLGSVYYRMEVFGRKPIGRVDGGLQVSAGVGLILALAILACFAGIIMDPLQVITRIHHRRLNKILGKVEANLLSNDSSQYSSKSVFIPRILDGLDLILSRL